ncbi:hypothetical protein Nepgr_003879 [Nepenthes gracilis]|uniref:Uncharacterized protein n=1 Tax=Nepenthes gracilis TaxID=150966 RepID=A0AAD3XEH3_NEPGR|nr:hypothetical protein Nepgr_003879 [Nepenthes gracilis]
MLGLNSIPGSPHTPKVARSQCQLSRFCPNRQFLSQFGTPAGQGWPPGGASLLSSGSLLPFPVFVYFLAGAAIYGYSSGAPNAIPHPPILLPSLSPSCAPLSPSPSRPSVIENSLYLKPQIFHRSLSTLALSHSTPSTINPSDFPLLPDARVLPLLNAPSTLSPQEDRSLDLGCVPRVSDVVISDVPPAAANGLDLESDELHFKTRSTTKKPKSPQECVKENIAVISISNSFEVLQAENGSSTLTNLLDVPSVEDNPFSLDMMINPIAKPLDEIVVERMETFDTSNSVLGTASLGSSHFDTINEEPESIVVLTDNHFMKISRVDHGFNPAESNLLGVNPNCPHEDPDKVHSLSISSPSEELALSTDLVQETSRGSQVIVQVQSSILLSSVAAHLAGIPVPVVVIQTATISLASQNGPMLLLPLQVVLYCTLVLPGRSRIKQKKLMRF